MEPNKLFFTTTDLLNKINSVIDQQNDEDNGGHDTRDKPKFELQRRLPNGTSRRAHQDEAAAADFQAKLKQAAERIASYSPHKKLEWTEYQRQEGNKLFAGGQYKEAMDVYLTCLVATDKNSVTDNGSTKGTTESNSSSSSNDDDLSDEEWQRLVNEQVKLPVLLNLSACTLKMGMFNKTCTFCDIALDIEKDEEKIMEKDYCNKDEKNNPSTQFSKVYFRRGRARMSMGLYDGAKSDLETSLTLLVDNTSENNTMGEKEQLAIKREMIKLETMRKNAEKNHKKQKRAMKQIFKQEQQDEQKQTQQHEDNSAIHVQEDVGQHDQANQSTERLYNESGTKEYSTLRSRMRKRKPQRQEECDNNKNTSESTTSIDWEPPTRLKAFAISILVIPVFCILYQLLVSSHV